MNSNLSVESAKQQFSEMILWLKEVTRENLKTKEGRDDIRRTFGCRIEGFESEDDEYFKAK